MLQIRKMGPQIGVEISGVDVKTMGEASGARSTRPGSTTTSCACATRT